MQAKHVAYYRVSTARQGRSGLGLEAQKQAVADYLKSRKAALREFTEVESGKHNDRPELARALQLCRQTGATLVIAKLDRLSRDAAFLLSLRDSKVEFVAADMPNANRLTVGVMALVAEQEREAISRRTREALAAYKRRQQRDPSLRPLGNPNGAAAMLAKGKGNRAALAAISARADRHAGELRPVIEELRADGVTSLEGLAAALNERGMQTPRGARWYASSVRNLLARI
jgi:DNA invertase Pin-like site-specific DNA recombinase